MSMKDSKYEAVIGLEVHIELKTKHKIFCDCEVSFGDPPNTHVCPVCLAMPGSLPVLNHEVVDFAICAGLLTNCEIALSSRIDRKNYFYPDLPKAYQLSQADEPLCRNGYVDVSTEDGTSRIRVNRIHIEEDAGKLIHTDEATSLIDMNRGGVPLIEIVSEPDIHSADEAVAYLRKLRSLVRYTGISDGRMNEGSLRCDVNLSIREKGSEVLGTRAEMKNLNSFNYIARAIESEFRRQVAIVEEGGTIEQETRRYDEKTDQTTAMRSKEDAADYRYFPDPDLCRIEVTPEEIAEIRAHIPKMAEERKLEYIDQFSLNEYEAERLTEDKVVANFFETAAKNSRYPKVLSSLIMTELSPTTKQSFHSRPSDWQHSQTFWVMKRSTAIPARRSCVSCWKKTLIPKTMSKSKTSCRLPTAPLCNQSWRAPSRKTKRRSRIIAMARRPLSRPSSVA